MLETSPLVPKPSSDASLTSLTWLRGLKICMVVIVAVSVFAVWWKRTATVNAQAQTFVHKWTVYVKSVPSDQYVRVEKLGLHLTESRPWVHGSSLELYHSERTSCFRIRSLKGGWLTVDRTNNLVTLTEEDIPSEAALFELDGGDLGPDADTTLATIKQCGKSKYWSVTDPTNLDSGVSQITLVKPSTQILHRRRSLSAESGSDFTQDAHSSDDSMPTQFLIEKVQPFHGVNLGGWFIPEIWMNPGFSNYTKLEWAGSLCNVVKFNRTLAEDAMQTHLRSWIQESDFREIAADGFTSVRLPVGYWNLLPDPYDLFVPGKVEDSLFFIDFAFDMCEKYGLTVLLDLHGAPGSQNGIDHSGCGMEASWLERKENRELTLRAIEIMAQRYGTRTALLGIEIANEPALKYCQDFLPEMTRLYEAAYRTIRRYSQSCLIVFNELYEVCYDAWSDKLQEPEYYNVLIDLHLYNWQLPYTMQSAVTHVANAVAWEDVIAQVSRSHPVIVGEWCFSTGTFVQAGQAFVSACVDSFRRAAGWYLWTWKVEPGIHFDEWDVQLQYRKSDGMHV